MEYPADTTVITLSRPLKTTTGEKTELHLREPTVRDKLAFEKTQGGALEKEITMIASLCGVEPSELYLLSAYDYAQLGRAVDTFLLPPEERSNPNS
ncbi:phage tail assembly protein [Buttiauxella sp. 3AFRM03]|uniref:phage tail assembly protein n=1 Tax=Buttiauxella sp. 3AFRM03 TaxID=2479367 RepID=UPI0013901121|nr:phage tail assembly protein [Buttiauxella sp. 3AFRM03]